jgi:hypothetical protein
MMYQQQLLSTMKMKMAELEQFSIKAEKVIEDVEKIDHRSRSNRLNSG